MAQLKNPIFAKASTYSVLAKAVAEGKLSSIDRAAYCYVNDTGHFYRIEPDKTISPIVGDNPQQIVRVDELPDVSEGNDKTLYIVGNVVYTFSDGAYHPTYESLQTTVDALIEIVNDHTRQIGEINTTVGEVQADIGVVKDDISTLQQEYEDLADLADRVDAKADKDSVYTKTEVDEKFDEKADVNDVYNKSDVDTLLDAKADSNSVYTKTEIDNQMDSKANSNDVYTKTEVDNKMGTLVDEHGDPISVQDYVDEGVQDAKDYVDEQMGIIFV